MLHCVTVIKGRTMSYHVERINCPRLDANAARRTCPTNPERKWDGMIVYCAPGATETVGYVIYWLGRPTGDFYLTGTNPMNKIKADVKTKHTRSPSVVRIADHIGCQWPSTSFKVRNFHFIWKSICHFLLVINSTCNIGGISHRFRDIASLSLKNAHISYPLHLTHIWQCSSCTRWLWLCRFMSELNTRSKLFVQEVFTYDLKFSHNTSVTQQRTDRRTVTDDNSYQ